LAQIDIVHRSKLGIEKAILLCDAYKIENSPSFPPTCFHNIQTQQYHQWLVLREVQRTPLSVHLETVIPNANVLMIKSTKRRKPLLSGNEKIKL
jgi:hypothetical protein